MYPLPLSLVILGKYVSSHLVVFRLWLVVVLFLWAFVLSPVTNAVVIVVVPVVFNLLLFIRIVLSWHHQFFVCRLWWITFYEVYDILIKAWFLFFNLFDSKVLKYCFPIPSFLFINYQCVFDEQVRLFWTLRNGEFTPGNNFKNLVFWLAQKGYFTKEKLIVHNSQRPYIRFGCVRFLFQHLGWHVNRSPDTSFSHSIQFSKILGKSKIANLENTIMNQYISWLKITMDNALFNDSWESSDELV
jgi:hypothetical protein